MLRECRRARQHWEHSKGAGNTRSHSLRADKLLVVAWALRWDHNRRDGRDRRRRARSLRRKLAYSVVPAHAHEQTTARGSEESEVLDVRHCALNAHARVVRVLRAQRFKSVGYDVLTNEYTPVQRAVISTAAARPGQ
tara:strand:- start:839 stop:1249 length:411 start_codon:yes stop_codon:yes gene_type:complete